jgi:hypothetical protein
MRPLLLSALLPCVALLVSGVLPASAGTAQVATRAPACEVPVEGGDCCDAYHACIDACAETFASDTAFCDATFPVGSRENNGCNALADHNYESCLQACEPRPPGC